MPRKKLRLASVLLFSAAPLLAPACGGSPPDNPDFTPQGQPSLAELAGELMQTPPDQALAEMPHFRPLCDAEGYPLVGNVMQKGTSCIGLQPSAFCAAVRATR